MAKNAKKSRLSRAFSASLAAAVIAVIFVRFASLAQSAPICADATGITYITKITPETLAGTWTGSLRVNGGEEDVYTLTFSPRGTLMLEERFMGSYSIDLATYRVGEGVITAVLRTGWLKGAEAEFPCFMSDGKLHITIDEDDGPCVFVKISEDSDQLINSKEG
jgi:hypothetical protein